MAAVGFVRHQIAVVTGKHVRCNLGLGVKSGLTSRSLRLFGCWNEMSDGSGIVAFDLSEMCRI